MPQVIKERLQERPTPIATLQALQAQKVPLQELQLQIEIPLTLLAHRVPLPERLTPIEIPLTLLAHRVPLPERPTPIEIPLNIQAHRELLQVLQPQIVTRQTTQARKARRSVMRLASPTFHHRRAMAQPRLCGEISTIMVCMVRAGTRIIRAHGQPLAGVPMTLGVPRPGILPVPGVDTHRQHPFTTTMATTSRTRTTRCM